MSCEIGTAFLRHLFVKEIIEFSTGERSSDEIALHHVGTDDAQRIVRLRGLGPTTFPRVVPIRPHDQEIAPASEGAIEGAVQSIMELGFEIQVTVAVSDGSTQMSRNEFRDWDVMIGSPMSIRERG